mmetsp:Transcript_31364/g.47972  ORF Transcript_31364/g.47972 Transcript_31364/m.47972 type:complete len:90 (+) Transcript_31364:3617-3886(+)
MKQRIHDLLKGPHLSEVVEVDPILKKVFADLGIMDAEQIPQLFSRLPLKQQVASAKKLVFLVTFLVKTFIGTKFSRDSSPIRELVGLLP